MKLDHPMETMRKFLSRMPVIWPGLSVIGLNLFAMYARAQPDSSAAYTFTTLAGYSLSDSSDGVGPQARFNQPTGIAADGNGNTYVVDELNFTVRRISAAGVVSTIAGFTGVRGYSDGLNTVARFYSPHAIATDRNGNVYVGDNYTVRRISPAGTNWLVTTIAGQLATQGYRDGLNLGARFNGPAGLAVDTNGTIYVADGPIRKITPTGSNWVVGTVANAEGYTIIQNNFGPNFTNSVGVFTGNANAIAIDDAGSLFVADQSHAYVSKLTLPDGTTNWVSATIAGLSGSPGSVDGLGAAARFQNPTGIGSDALGNLYVADGRRVIRALVPQEGGWLVSTLAGLPGNDGAADGIGTNALFNGLSGLTIDRANNLVITDTGNKEVRTVTAAGVVKTIAGSVVADSSGSLDGVGAQARFNFPGGVAVDGAGNVYVADSGSSTIRLVTPAGIVSTIAGSVGNAGSVDGVGANARFNQPEGIAVDHAGNVFVADYYNHTIRMISPAAVVSTIGGAAGIPGDAVGDGGSARFSYPYDLAADGAGNLFVTDSGNQKIRKLTRNGTNWVVSTVATVTGYPSGIAVAGDGRLFVLSGSVIQQILPNGPDWVVSNIASSSPSYSHIAVDGSGRLFIPTVGNRTVLQVAPVGPTWVVTTIGGSAGAFFDGGNADGAGLDARFKVPYGIATDSAGNLYLTDVVNNNIRKGIFTQYHTASAIAISPPPASGFLRVSLLPPEANGQWRFPWEFGWRNSETTASNLVAGNYQIEFRSVPGWIALPTEPVQVAVGGTTAITNLYYPTIDGGNTNVTPGSLTVFLGPTPPVGAGWRFLGDTGPFLPTGFTTNLPPDIYLIEFEPVSGRSRPPSQAVQVSPGTPAFLSVNYLLASLPPANVYLPFPVPANQLANETTFPFGFNGQLQSDNGYGSGMAVQTNVVLTAAHLVFNDQTLTYVNRAFWFFRRDAGANEPLPQAARGFYVLSGYAEQRTNDLASGYSPDQSTPPSRNMDVAALYFLSPVAGGGHGGFLPSDAEPNTWLTGSALKMLVGYPVDGSQFGDAGIVPGKMYQTDPQPYPLSLAPDPVPGRQQVYVAPWLLSYPGNSGGPLCVQFNGHYYPAAVYLGTLFSGSQPYASVVRAIDSNVVNLITLAATQGDNGTNYTGGGVTTLTTGLGGGAFAPGTFQVVLGPSNAVVRGGGWRLLQGSGTNFLSDNVATYALTQGTNYGLTFRPALGYVTPTNRTLRIVAGQSTVVTVNYVSSIPTATAVGVANGVVNLTLTGAAGQRYAIEWSTNLVNWQARVTNTTSAGGLLNFNETIPVNPPRGFYRARFVP